MRIAIISVLALCISMGQYFWTGIPAYAILMPVLSTLLVCIGLIQLSVLYFKSYK